MSNEIPRRNRLDRMLPAELAIVEAVRAVEAAGCDVRLTNAINKLHEARELVADFMDANGFSPPTGDSPPLASPAPEGATEK